MAYIRRTKEGAICGVERIDLLRLHFNASEITGPPQFQARIRERQGLSLITSAQTRAKARTGDTGRTSTDHSAPTGCMRIGE
jgi:hypothetical protein